MAQEPAVGYTENYPLGGDIALLCEGDIVGYESSILKRWIDQNAGTSPMVDVWPCGTAEAIFGMSDAIGRSRPLIVIEDRDFRTKAEATIDCENWQKDRERRAVRVLMWRAWSRAEIENYFLDEAVLSKVMIESFECTDADLREAISDVLTALAVTQAALCTFYRIRRKWKLCDPDAILRSNAPFRAQWDDRVRKHLPPSRSDIEKQMKVNVDKWRGSSELPDVCALSWPEIQKEFDEICTKWSKLNHQSAEWLSDWAGKEILHALWQWLSARFGWYDRNTGKRSAVEWGTMKRERQRSLDREIENTLRPAFVRALLENLSVTSNQELRKEWQAILDAVLSCGRAGTRPKP